MATVCDQGGPNRAAINLLIQETVQQNVRKGSEGDKIFGFRVGGMEIVPLFDVPHLFKGLRNNLLTKNLHFKMNNENCIAKWLHIQQFYLLDTEDQDRICPKLTDQHILPEKINKMKVRCCTQVFSHQVGTLMKKILSWSKYFLFIIINIVGLYLLCYC